MKVEIHEENYEAARKVIFSNDEYGYLGLAIDLLDMLFWGETCNEDDAPLAKLLADALFTKIEE